MYQHQIDSRIAKYVVFLFPQFSVDEIYMRNGNQNFYFMIIHSSNFNYGLIRRTFYYYLDSITYWFYLLHKLKLFLVFPEPFPGKFRNNFSVNRNFPERSGITEQCSGNFRFTDKKSRSGIDPEFRTSGTLSLMEMEKKFRIISVRKP